MENSAVLASCYTAYFFIFFPVFLLIYFHKKETAFKATKPKTVSRSARFTSWESFKQL